MERDSFIFYRSFSECIRELDPDVRRDCYEALIDYALDGIEPDAEGVVQAMFRAFKPQIDANNKRYENGKRGGRPKINQNVTKEKPNDNQNVTELKPNVNVNEKKKGRSFVKPSIQEVSDYCRERNNNVDAQAFVDFYESKGWLIGKEKMKDWKAAVRTWERRQSGTKFNDIHNNAYDFDDLESKLMAN